MSKWAQDAARVDIVRQRRDTDYDRWATIDNHNEGWVNRVKLAVQYVPKGAAVLELGAGRAFMRGLLDSSCRYTPSDIVAHEPDFLLVDLNKPFQFPRHYDVIVALGVLEYVHDVAGILAQLKRSASRLIFSYCCRMPDFDVDVRMRQGWLSDLDENALDRLVDANSFDIVRKFAIQPTPSFTQIMYVLDVLKHAAG